MTAPQTICTITCPGCQIRPTTMPPTMAIASHGHRRPPCGSIVAATFCSAGLAGRRGMPPCENKDLRCSSLRAFRHHDRMYEHLAPVTDYGMNPGVPGVMPNRREFNHSEMKRAPTSSGQSDQCVLGVLGIEGQRVNHVPVPSFLRDLELQVITRISPSIRRQTLEPGHSGFRRSCRWRSPLGTSRFHPGMNRLGRSPSGLLRS